ncbi:MAG: hypothetical protein QG566_117 [Patescibacteria group bacterium]|jgi:thiol-disulfide isomerase/thioredoxin|nr:hypothetical protein [Patescibacteria group bacterium]
MTQTKKFIVITLLVIVLVVVLGVFANKPKAVGKYGPLAQCIKDSGAEFYGAFWCPHCQSQKALFGGAKNLLPYIECSNPDRSVTQICLDKKIEGYPTWIFPSGEKLYGEVDLKTLAEKTQCVLPQ